MPRFLANLTVLQKLLIPVPLVIAMTLGITWLATATMTTLAQSSDRIVRDYSPHLLRIETVVADLNQAAVNVRDLIFDADPAHAERLKAARETTMKKVADGIDALVAKASSPAERDFATRLRDIFVDFDPQMRSVADVALSGKRAEAFQMTIDRVPIRKKMGELIEAEVKRVNGLMQEAVDQGQAEQARARILLIAVGLAGVVGSVVMIAGIAMFQVARPLRGMTTLMKELAAGHLDIAIAGGERRDEVGDVARALAHFKAGLQEARRLAEAQAEEQRAKETRAAQVRTLTSAFDAQIGQVVQAVSSQAVQMEGSAQSLSGTAEESTKQAATVAAASEQASANVQTVATATEELSSSIGEISRQVAQSSRIAGSAVTHADKANRQVQGLVDASQRIGEVVSLITDIADQTNLLALNATIEAARAGEAGKGFAVVAAEVKNLANQTAKATDDIRNQIKGVQTATQEAVQAIQIIGKTIGEMNDITTTVAAAIEEQSAATREIARNVEQAATGTQEVTSNIAGVSRAANDTGSAAAEVLTSARDLAKQSTTLASVVEAFLTQVKAA